MSRHDYGALGWADDGMEDFEFNLVIPGAPFVQKNSKTPRLIPQGKKPGAKRGPFRCGHCGKGQHVILDPTAAYKQWRKQAVEILRELWGDLPPIPVWLDAKKTRRMEVNAAIVTHQHTRRVADADNLLSGPMDAMKEAGVIEDDVIVRTLNGSDRDYDKENPRVQVTLTRWRARQ